MSDSLEDPTEQVILYLSNETTLEIRLSSEELEAFVAWMDANTRADETMRLHGIDYTRNEAEAFRWSSATRSRMLSTEHKPRTEKS